MRGQPPEQGSFKERLIAMFAETEEELNRMPGGSTSTRNRLLIGGRFIKRLIVNGEFDDAKSVHDAYMEMRREVVGEEDSGEEGVILPILMGDYFGRFGCLKKVDEFLSDIAYIIEHGLLNLDACQHAILSFLKEMILQGVIREESEFDAIVFQIKRSLNFDPFKTAYIFDYENFSSLARGGSLVK
ncbi:MAG: hypothetical protein WCT46_01195 [Candidatus Gracilibacteria bacterium]|jgi:hypothetical protein